MSFLATNVAVFVLNCCFLKILHWYKKSRYPPKDFSEQNIILASVFNVMATLRGLGNILLHKVFQPPLHHSQV